MLKLFIFAITMLLLSGLCNGQGVTTYGASRPQDTSKTKGQQVWTAYAGAGDTTIVIVLPNGTVKTVSKNTFGTLYSAGFGINLTGTRIDVDTNVMLRIIDPTRSVLFGSLQINNGSEFLGYVNMSGLDLGEEGSIVTIDEGNTLGVSNLETNDLLTWSDTVDVIATKGDFGRIISPAAFGDTLRNFGDSYAACAGASVSDSCYSNLLAEDLNIPKVNYASGGTGIRYAALQAYNLKPRDRGLYILNAGLNDAYAALLKGFSLTSLYNYWGNYENLFLTSCFEDTVSSVQSSYFTKNGTITTNSASTSRSVALGSLVTVMNVAGDYVEFTTADSGFFVHFFKTTLSRLGSIRVSVGSLTVDTLVPQSESWVIDLHSNDSIAPTAKYYSLKGYGAGSKTVRFTAIDGGGATQWWVDAVGFPKTDADKRAVIMMESAQIPLAGENYLNADRVFATNAARRNYAAKYWQGFPIRIIKQPLNLQSDFHNDGVHPNDRGHRVYDSAFLATINNCIDNNVYFQDYNPSGGALTTLQATQVAGNFTVSVNGSTATINNPYATSTTPGLVSAANQNFPGGAKRFTDIVQVATLTTNGGVLYANAVQTLIQDGSFFVYNPTTKSLGIGDPTPDDVLDIEKNQNAGTGITVTNTNGGASANSYLNFFTSGSNNGGVYKRSPAAAALGTAIQGNDLMIYNFAASVASNIILYNDNPVGKITMTAGAGTTPTFMINSTGRIKIGDDGTPTGVLHLKAGTATASTAPLKFTAGTNLTTPEAGAVEFDGTNYFASVGSTRYTVAKTLTNTAALDFASTGAQTSSELTITVTGAALGDAVTLGVPSASESANSCFTAYVSAADTVTVKFNNYSAGGIDPSSGTFRVSVFKY